MLTILFTLLRFQRYASLILRVHFFVKKKVDYQHCFSKNAKIKSQYISVTYIFVDYIIAQSISNF